MHPVISPFQLSIFYLTARLASVGAMVSSTRMPGNLIPALLMGGLFQTILLLLCQHLCRRNGGNSYPRAGVSGYRGASAPAWFFFLTLCGWTAAQNGLILAGIYQREAVLPGVTALLIASGIYGAVRGLEASARSVPILALVILPCLMIFAAGMFSHGVLWNLSAPDWNPSQLLALSMMAGAAPELPVLLFLLPESRSEFRTRWSVAMGLIPALWGLVLTAGTMMALGEGRMTADSQLGLAAQAGELLFLRRLDGIFMTAWTLMSFVQTVFCFLAVWKAGNFCFSGQNKHPVRAGLLYFLLIWGIASMFQQGDSLTQWFSLGVGGTIAGSLALPLLFRACSGRNPK